MYLILNSNDSNEEEEGFKLVTDIAIATNERFE
jgi:hypothetical protein